MTALVLRAAGVLCACAGLGLTSLTRSQRARTAAPPSLVARLANRYDRSPAATRLAKRLWRAQIDLSPSRWRCAQFVLSAPVLTMLLVTGMPLLTAAGAATGGVRFASWTVLVARRRRARAALDAAAPAIARALATELAAWANGTQAIIAASGRCARGSNGRMASRVLDGAATAVMLGAGAATSLRSAMDDAVGRVRPASPAARVAAVFSHHANDVAACATALDSLARGLETDAGTIREVSAGVAEVRMSAFAVPVIAAVTGALLFASDPAALVAALTPPLLPFLGLALVAVVGAVVVVRRMTAT